MKTIYLDCGMGAAGDMLTAALIELLPDPDEMLKRLNELPLPGIVFQREKIERSGITGTHMHVFVNGEELAKYMIEYNIGLSVKKTYEVKRIDIDYFED